MGLILLVEDEPGACLLYTSTGRSKVRILYPQLEGSSVAAAHRALTSDWSSSNLPIPVYSCTCSSVDRACLLYTSRCV